MRLTPIRPPLSAFALILGWGLGIWGYMEHRHHTTSEPRHRENIPLGVMFGILAAFFFSLISLLVKLVSDRASPDEIIFARLIVSLILILPWVVSRPREILRISQPWQIIGRSVSTLLATGSMIYSLKFLPLTSAVLLTNTYPLFVPMIFWLFSQIKTPWKVWMGISVGFFGIVLFLHPDPRVWNVGSAIGMASALFSAISIVLIRQMTKTISVLQILFYNFFIGSVVTGILLPFNWSSLSIDGIVLLIGVGIFGVSYQVCSTLSLAKAPARIGSPLMFLAILFAALIEYFIWGEVPDRLSLIGSFFVVLGGVVTIYYGQKEFTPNPKANVKL